MSDFTGRLALVTGAASGIGAASARLLAERGARVVCADRDLPGVRAVADAIARDGHEAAVLSLDVADEVAWDVASSRVGRRAGSTCWCTAPASPPRVRSSTRRWPSGGASSP